MIWLWTHFVCHVLCWRNTVPLFYSRCPSSGFVLTSNRSTRNVGFLHFFSRFGVARVLPQKVKILEKVQKSLEKNSLFLDSFVWVRASPCVFASLIKVIQTTGFTFTPTVLFFSNIATNAVRLLRRPQTPLIHRSEGAHMLEAILWLCELSPIGEIESSGSQRLKTDGLECCAKEKTEMSRVICDWL